MDKLRYTEPSSSRKPETPQQTFERTAIAIQEANNTITSSKSAPTGPKLREYMELHRDFAAANAELEANPAKKEAKLKIAEEQQARLDEGVQGEEKFRNEMAHMWFNSSKAHAANIKDGNQKASEYLAEDDSSVAAWISSGIQIDKGR